jgi:hypothetical protein
VIRSGKGVTLSAWRVYFSPRTRSSSHSLWACVSFHDSEHVRVIDAELLTLNMTSQVILVFHYGLGSHGLYNVRRIHARRCVIVADRIIDELRTILIGPGVVVRLVVGYIRGHILGLDIGSWGHWRPIEGSAVKASWRVHTGSTRARTWQIVAIWCGRTRDWHGESRHSLRQRRESHERRVCAVRRAGTR